VIDRYDMEHAFDFAVRRGGRLAAATARTVQHGDLRRYLWVVCAACFAFVVWGLAASGRAPRFPDAWGFTELRIGPAVVALVGVVGAFAAVRARTLVATMIAVGLTGFVAALTFMMNGAPDIALTQFAVESLVVVLLTVVLLVLPLEAPSTRTRRERTLDAGLATAFALVMLVVLLDMGATSRATPISDFFAAHSYLSAFGRNVVNVILVDFRGFDTLGETTVIAMASILAWSLLGPRTTSERRAAPVGGRTIFILTMTSRLFFWLLLTLSVLILLRGHNEIGGGFVGGLTAALAFAVISISDGVGRARTMLRLHPLSLAGGGLLLAIESGMAGVFAQGNFLHHVWLELTVFGVPIKQGTTLLFDLGVYLVVLGAVLAFLFALRREAGR
jgi:multicomponent Na+:H+ antiporter subunit A